MPHPSRVLAAIALLLALLPIHSEAQKPMPAALTTQKLRAYVDAFNRTDNETVVQATPNAGAYDWLAANVPLFECPDKDIERTYYFRWWTYRKQIRKTPTGYVVTEFLPDVPWAGKLNTIPCAAGHHLYEGRWLADPRVLDDYSEFWFKHGGEPRRYSFWAADAIYARALVTGDMTVATDLLPDLVANFEGWCKERRDPNGLFWQEDGQDGMEVSIGGSGYRATINSYMFAEAVAISRIARLAGRQDLVDRFTKEADAIRKLTVEKLWDAQAGFFKVLPRGEGAGLADVRELHGYTPWYAGLVEGKPYADAWKQLTDPQGFYAPFGPTTAERRHPRFMFHADHECLWNGPSWPYATSITLTGLANMLNAESEPPIGKDAYLDLLRIYARSQQLKREDGTTVPWIDEDLDADTGAWIARDILLNRGVKDRGKDYNHSTFCDLVITGLVGLRPRADDTVEVNPLVPDGAWDYFCLDRVRYRGRLLTILFDRTGERYHRGAGLRILADGREIAHADGLQRVTAPLPPAPGVSADGQTAGGWVKSPHNPVLGGQYGTCFDVSVLRVGGLYRMWVSWRPKKSIAIVDSKDGVHWSEPYIVLEPDPASKWEEDINRPVVVKRPDGYHMWYTGQANGRSAIGYATSPDGVVWTRRSAQPVLAPEAHWEGVALMCPHVLWDAKARVWRMWYSGGEQYEPNAIGYATSADGLHWTKRPEPVFTPSPDARWERERVTACQVVQQGDWYVMFYIGFRDIDHAQIGIARSRDGITNWERHPANPIVRAGANCWDHDACYKPFAVLDGKRWLLWYNGRHGGLEQIGLVTHQGANLGFPRGAKR